jgi:hypothetical protein
MILPLVILGLGVLVVATAVAIWGWKLDERGLEPSGTWILLNQISSRSRYSSKSTLGLAASFYYAVAPLVFPVSMLISYILLRRDKRGLDSQLHKKPLNANGRFTGIFSGSLLIAFSVLVLTSVRGENTRYFSVSDSVLSLVLEGWIIFAIAGMIAGVGAAFLRLSIFRPFPR